MVKLATAQQSYAEGGPYSDIAKTFNRFTNARGCSVYAVVFSLFKSRSGHQRWSGYARL